MTLPHFEIPKPGKHGILLYELAASTMKRRDLLGYLGAVLRQQDGTVSHGQARRLMELVGIPHGERGYFTERLVYEAKRQKDIAIARIRARQVRASNTRLHRRLRAFRLLFPDEEVTRYFATLLNVTLKKGVHVFVESFDCRLRPVHSALVLVTHRDDDPREVKPLGFFLYRTPKGRLGSVSVSRSQPPKPGEPPKTPAIPGLISALEVDSVVAARAKGCTVKVLWDRQQHHVRHPDGRELVVAWRSKLVF